MKIITTNMLQKWWISNSIVGKCKRKIYTVLYRIYSFSDWHIEPINFRPYARETVLMIQKYIEEKKLQCVVEVGCGLGDIIGNIRVMSGRIEKVGIDKERNVIRAAQLLHPSTRFCEGSFEQCMGFFDSTCLIMVNFIHRISKGELKRTIRYLLSGNQIDLVVFDTFLRNENTEYLCSHCGEELLGEEYRCIKKSRGFVAAHGARRYIEYWEKVKTI